MTAGPTVVFTCCGGVGGRSFLRSLAKTGRYRLICCDSNALVTALHQPKLAGRYVISSGYDPAYIDRVLHIFMAGGADVFWPNADEEILACSAAAERFDAAEVYLVSSPHSTILASTDKLATAAGINFPDIIVRIVMGQTMVPLVDYRTDVMILTSREQLAIALADLLGELPEGGIAP